MYLRKISKTFFTLKKKKGDPLTPKEIRKLMEEADLNNDKKLDYKEVNYFIYFLNLFNFDFS